MCINKRKSLYNLKCNLSAIEDVKAGNAMIDLKYHAQC